MTRLTTVTARVSAGRPTREAAARRQRELLDQAMEMFLERGFERTTISDVAAAAGMTRRTVYAKYADKHELLRATLENGAGRLAVPTDALDSVDTSDLEAALIAFVRLRVDTTLTPLGIQVQRFIHAEARRFPLLVGAIYARISEPTTERIAALLERIRKEGDTVIDDPVWAARCLMNMAVGAPLTMALLTGVFGIDDFDAHIRRSVDTFLRGILVR